MTTDEKLKRLSELIDRVPLDVMLRGPHAIMDFLVKEDDNMDDLNAQSIKQAQEIMEKIMAEADDRQPLSVKNAITSGMAACIMVATALATAATSGNRAKARDALSQALDAGFDMLDQPVPAFGGKSWSDGVRNGLGHLRKQPGDVRGAMKAAGHDPATDPKLDADLKERGL